MKTVLALRHVPFEDLGSFADVLQREKLQISYLEVGLQKIDRKAAKSPELLVVLGGSIGAYEERKYPFLLEELKFIETRLAADLPTLGICLGAQLMARAFGAKVYQGHEKEIGWSPLLVTEEGKNSPVRHLASSKTSMLHWHGDTFDLPEGACLLASTNKYKNQIFSKGQNALAIQCHPEVRFDRLEQWFVGHASELQTEGVSIPTLRNESLEQGPSLMIQGQKFFEEWLGLVGLN